MHTARPQVGKKAFDPPHLESSNGRAKMTRSSVLTPLAEDGSSDQGRSSSGDGVGAARMEACPRRDLEEAEAVGVEGERGAGCLPGVFVAH